MRKYAILFGLILSVLLTACKNEKQVTAEEEKNEWAVYWYLCGSNLESDSGSATKDIEEMLSVKIPESVKVVIEAGGSETWNTKEINPKKTTRLLYDGEKLKTLDSLPMANMGEAATLSDFLSFCLSEYPAEHTMLIFWDHGGGSLYGVCYDENYGMDCLTYTELTEAFKTAGNPQFDMIGFDACLMSSIDTISVCREHAQYMLASEQLEPTCGWDYAALFKTFTEDGGVTAEMLGRSICDGFYAGCEKEGMAGSATLCLCDLAKAGPLLEDYERKLYSWFDRVLVSDEEAASLRRSALESENYGANGKSVGYTDMIDLSGYLGTEGSAVDYTFVNLIEDSVTYQVRGESVPRGCGISCYYPLDASLRSVLQYASATAPKEDVSLFYRYMINPDLSDPVSGYAERRNISETDILKNHFRAATVSLSDSPLEFDGSDITLQLGDNVASNLSDVTLRVTGTFEVENTLFSTGDTMFFHMEEGEYPTKEADYTAGTFLFDSTAKKVTIDGVAFATYVGSDSAEQTLLYAPAVIDDRDGVLFFSVSKADGKISFLGAYTGKVHTTGEYTMAGIFSEDEEPADAAEYGMESSLELEPFDYSFTFEELYEYHETFGMIGEPAEMEEYFHGKESESEEETEEDSETPDMENYVYERLSPLSAGQKLTPVYHCRYTKTMDNDETSFFTNWETTDTITYGDRTKFTYEAGQYSDDYERTVCYSYILSDAWGNTAESELFWK